MSQHPIHPDKKLKSLENNSPQYIAKIIKRLENFVGQEKDVTFQKEAPEIMVKECIEGLNRFCMGVNTPKNYEIASHLMCYSVKYPAIENSYTNGKFAIQIALELIGLDVGRVLKIDKEFIARTNEFIQPAPSKRIEGQIRSHNIILRDLCEEFGIHDRCSL